MCPTIVPLMRETKKEQDIYFTSLIETMKILVATEKPFAKKAVDGIRKIVEDAGYELALLEKYPIPDIEVLVVGHHGSKYSSCREFLAATRPEIAVISVGRNSYGHPASETLERLEEAGALVRRTDREGTITIHGGDEHGGT